MDVSDGAIEVGDIYHVPDIYTNSFTVQTQSTPGTEVTLGSPTQNDVTITVNDHTYIAYILGDMQIGQIGRSYNVFKEYAVKAGKTLIDEFEDDLFALWSGLTTNSIGDTATILNDSEVRQAVEALDTLNIPIANESAWFFHPHTYWIQILSVQKYYVQSQFSNSFKGVVPTGTLDGRDLSQGGGFRGMLYGSPLFVSSNVVQALQTTRNLYAHRTALGFVVQTPQHDLPGNPVRHRAADWLANLGVLVIHDVIKGTGEIRDQAAVVVNANSSFIGS